MLIDFGEREKKGGVKEGRREKYVCDRQKHPCQTEISISCLPYMLPWGSNPQPFQCMG